MRHSSRMFLVGLIVMAMSVHPASAWHWGCNGCAPCGPVYHEPVYDGCCGGEVVVYDEGCGGCDPCGGVVVEGEPVEPVEERAPAPPAEERPAPTTPPEQPPVEQPTVERPVETAPVPVEPTLPAEEPDGLFNGTEEAAPPEMEEPEPPAEEPADLFGEPAETAPPAEAAPAEEPAEEPLDLFGEPAETEPEMPAETEEQPAAEEPAEGESTEDTDDIFGATRGVLREAGGLASEDLRLWVDNTGGFSCRGRLISLLEGHVRLLKDNGRMTTVPLHRLGASDLEFVHRQAGAQQAKAFQTAQSLAAAPGLAN